MSKLIVRTAIDSLELGGDNTVYRKIPPPSAYKVIGLLNFVNSNASYSTDCIAGYGDCSEWVEYTRVRGYGGIPTNTKSSY